MLTHQPLTYNISFFFTPASRVPGHRFLLPVPQGHCRDVNLVRQPNCGGGTSEDSAQILCWSELSQTQAQ